MVRERFAAPLVLVFERNRLQPTPASLGATALARQAVTRAAKARPGTAVPLAVRVRGERVRAYVERLAERWNRATVDSRLYLRELQAVRHEGRHRPVVRPRRRDEGDRVGRSSATGARRSGSGAKRSSPRSRARASGR